MSSWTQRFCRLCSASGWIWDMSTGELRRVPCPNGCKTFDGEWLHGKPEKPSRDDLGAA